MNSLKERLIEKIKANNDEELLNEIFQLLESEERNYPIVKFNESQENKIRESEEEYKRGNIVSDEEVQKRIDKWLKE